MFKVSHNLLNDISNQFSFLKSFKKENFYVLFLTQKNKILHLNDDERIVLGSAKKVLIKPRSILEACLRRESNHIILLHNHPSGNYLPSRKDLYTTALLKSHLAFFDIFLIDHIIITGKTFSFMRANLI